jgi:putative glycosyltransferase
MDLSIVSSLYRSAPYLEEFHRRISTAAQRLGLDYEIILVNDGSPDESLEIALELQRNDSRLSIIDLSRNFGHHKAMMTGLAHTRGRRVFMLDADLEEEPELLSLFASTMERTEADVVYGVQESRKGGSLERVTGAFFYRLFKWLSDEEVAPNQLCARLMSRRYVDSLVAHRDREIFMAGLCSAAGYRQVALPTHKHHKGESSYTLPRKISLAVSSITSFSSRPLELIFYFGSMILALSLAGAFILIVRRLFFGQMLPGWASIMVALCFMGGLNLFCVGIVGIYLAKVFSETKDRPYTVVRKIYPAAASGESAASGPAPAAMEQR